MLLAPSEIRFMQDSICWKFRNGRSVNGSITSIINGCMKATDFPRITVVERDGKYYSEDNRRLYVFRVLERKGLLGEIDVSRGYYIPSSKFTTVNDGLSVRVRGATTHPHTSTASTSVHVVAFTSTNALARSPRYRHTASTVDIYSQARSASSARSTRYHVPTTASTSTTIGYSQVRGASSARLPAVNRNSAVKMAPDKIRFYRDCINDDFFGNRVNHVIDLIAENVWSVEKLQKIQVFKHEDGFYYARFNNRKLYVARALLYMGKLDKVEVNIVEKGTATVSTTNRGQCVRINSGKQTYPHSPTQIMVKQWNSLQL